MGMHVADYVPLRKPAGGVHNWGDADRDEFYLYRGADVQYQDLHINLPDGAIVEEPAILSFIAKPGNAEGLKLLVRIVQIDLDDDEPGGPTSPVGWERFDGSSEDSRGLSYVVRGMVLSFPTATARFKIEEGTGGVGISNVVLWFQRDIAAR